MLKTIIQKTRLATIILNGRTFEAEGAKMLLINMATTNFWINVEHLKLKSFPLKAAFAFFDAVQMSKLQSLTFSTHNWLSDDFNVPLSAPSANIRNYNLF